LQIIQKGYNTQLFAMDGAVELQDIPVMRVKANMKGSGPSEAFTKLESKLSSLKGRKFYGTFRNLLDGQEEYYACVEQVGSDDPEKMQLERGLIPGGKYARRKLVGWAKIVREGKLPEIFQEFAKSTEPLLDHDDIRPSVEFYRSQNELILYLPVKNLTLISNML
jgi:hypothetical protein